MNLKRYCFYFTLYIIVSTLAQCQPKSAYYIYGPVKSFWDSCGGKTIYKNEYNGDILIQKAYYLGKPNTYSLKIDTFILNEKSFWKKNSVPTLWLNFDSTTSDIYAKNRNPDSSYFYRSYSQFKGFYTYKNKQVYILHWYVNDVLFSIFYIDKKQGIVGHNYLFLTPICPIKWKNFISLRTKKRWLSGRKQIHYLNI